MHFAIEKKIFIFAIMKLSIIIPVYNTEQTLEKELVLKNHSKVMYDPDLIPAEMIKQ